MQSRAWWPLAVVGSVSGVVSCWLTTWIIAGGAGATPPGPVAQFDEATWTRRFDELGARVESRLAEISAMVASPSAVRTEASPSATAPSSRQMDRLEERMEQVVRALASSPRSEVALSRSQPAHPGELQSLQALDRQDKDAARRSTMLLTAAEVAARFGFPDEVGGAHGGGVFWNYYHRGPTGERDGSTLFVFLDGRVAWHEISTPNR